jgi:P27 family predicted phage terminase small subunit
MNTMHALPTPDSEAAGKIASSVQQIPAEIPDAPAKFSAREKKIWEHITGALFEVGLVHRTDALALTVICKTFASWINSEEQLAELMKNNGGSYIVTTPNGYQQPHQLYYVARNFKRELLQWLPEAALTIPSFQKIVGERAAPQQGSLFEDPIEAHKKRRTEMGLRMIQGGSAPASE